MNNGQYIIICRYYCYRENKVLQQENEDYLKQQKDNLQAVDPKLALAEQRLEAMFQELVSLYNNNKDVLYIIMLLWDIN